MHSSQTTADNFDLSFQDKYILSFERNDFNFNSHLIIETSSKIDLEKFNVTLKNYFEYEEYLRIIPDMQTGKFRLIALDNQKIKSAIVQLHENEITAFRNKKFNFDNEYGIRIGIVNEGRKIIFSFHHSLFDGHAQFNFLQDFLTIYNNEETYVKRKKLEIYQFRKYFKSISISWIIKYFFELISYQVKPRKRATRKKIARLFDHEPTDRVVRYKVLEIPRKKIDTGARKNALSSSAYLSMKASMAINEVLKMRGDLESPIVLYIPKSMRFEFKVMRHFQNLLGFIWMKIDRNEFYKEDFAKNFRDTYKFRSSESEVRKTLLVAAILVRLKKFESLKKFIKHKEEDIHDCTLLISSGRTPQEIVFPKEWKVEKLYPVGAMTRSPGIGILSSSFGENDYIVVEYLKSAFNSETIELFCDRLLNHL
jgi:hypothetical protein